MAVVKAVRPTEWFDHWSGSGKSGESYREGLFPTKVEVDGAVLSNSPLLFCLEDNDDTRAS